MANLFTAPTAGGLHAAYLLATIAAALAALLRGARPLAGPRQRALSLLRALARFPLYALVFALLPVIGECCCPSLWLQYMAPALLAACAHEYLAQAFIRRVVIAMLYCAAVALSIHHLALTARGACLYGGNPGTCVGACDAEYEARPVWHSWFTHLYAVHRHTL
ncbi:MAG: hypothetical protein AB7Q81_17785 [Gammaproteobacteria bacterium]